jgi:phosphoribosylformylglycinamidine synthase subunit PurSL
MSERYRIEVHNRDTIHDPALRSLVKTARESGLPGLNKIIRHSVYIFEGSVDDAAVRHVAEQLLIDPLTQSYVLGPCSTPEGCESFSVSYRPGVSEAIMHSLWAALKDLNSSLKPLGTADRYHFYGELESAAVKEFASRFIYNPLAECLGEPGEVFLKDKALLDGRDVPLDRLSDEELLATSKALGLALNVEEMQVIREHFKKRNRAPRLIELETLAQTWSEHCVHKTFKAKITHGDRVFNNLLKDTVFSATDRVNSPYCVSVFSDNAGIVKFDDDYDLCFKAETHNHPSAIAPYGGSATGLGGVIRDILGAGLGARPIVGLDVFCLGPQDLPNDELPAGTHHPRRIKEGVIAGVRDYGNRIGLPTAVGSLYYGEGYIANPIVIAGSLGVMPVGFDQKEPRVGDLAVLMGGRTGRDGIHGVTFSSESLSSESEELDRTAVQIGDPIVEQVLIDPLLRARDRRLYTSITDCGGGGLSSALGEMGEKTGIEVDLDQVPLKQEGLTATEIWISESQERMVVSVPEENWDALSSLFHEEDVLCTRIGRFTGDQRLTLKYNGEVIGDLGMDFLHDGLPRRELVSVPPRPRHERDVSDDQAAYPGLSWTAAVLAIFSHPNVQSKDDTVRQYDHEVQGRTVQGPFAGKGQGPQDGAVILPRLDSNKGAVLAVGFNPLQSPLDAYRMAANAVDEAIRNVVASGGDPDRLSLLDNFIWGDVSDKEELGKLVEATLACQDLALDFDAPFISGKDSLNNTHVDSTGHKRSITPTLVISALTLMDDVSKAVSIDFKGVGSSLYLVGSTAKEYGGSVYYHVTGRGERGVVPRVDGKENLRHARALHNAMNAGLVASCHDCSEGGVAIAVAEMALAAELGAVLELDSIPGCDAEDLLFSESSGRYVVEVAKGSGAAFEACFEDLHLFKIGAVQEQRQLLLKNQGQDQQLSVEACRNAWLGQ